MMPYPIHPLIPLGIIVGLFAGLALALIIMNLRESVFYPMAPQSSRASIGLGIALVLVAIAAWLLTRS